MFSLQEIIIEHKSENNIKFRKNYSHTLCTATQFLNHISTIFKNSERLEWKKFTNAKEEGRSNFIAFKLHLTKQSKIQVK